MVLGAGMITVVIPCRMPLTPLSASVTRVSLANQTRKADRVITQGDEGKGAGYARNHGAALVETEYMLLSDDDIHWKVDALETLLKTLQAHPEASFAYGAYRCNWRGPEMHTISWQEWDPELLRKQNYISSMALWRTKDFVGFDESLKRYMDWDIYLSAAEQGKVGVFCRQLLFETRLSEDGVTWGSISMAAAKAIIAKKHGLTL